MFSAHRLPQIAGERPLTCRQLLDELQLAGKRVALERNGEIVPRSRLGNEMLADGDKGRELAAWMQQLSAE